MELIWTAFLLGLVGSLHCAVMCGPLVLAVSRTRLSSLPATASQLVYHAGRIATYCTLGALFGAVGKTFALAGFQRGLSIFAGAAILIGLMLSSRATLKTPVANLVLKLKTAFARLLQKRTASSQFALGAINGLLPCGLVYIAAASAATTLTPELGAMHMAAFGLGTLPMLLGISVLGGKLCFPNTHTQNLIRASVAVMGILLVLRGMALGIPFLSPAMSGGTGACH
jgi:sulfite exporter TauE/SafE